MDCLALKHQVGGVVVGRRVIQTIYELRLCRSWRRSQSYERLNYFTVFLRVSLF